MEEGNQVLYRDAYLGEVQRNARTLEKIRFLMVATLC
jgi:hypothetical protein